MTDIYQAPSANLSEPNMPFDGNGSLENGIAGNYDFTIGDIISKAWAKTQGNKGTVWLAILFYILASIAIVVVSFIFLFIVPILGAFLSPLLQFLVLTPVMAGLYMVGIKIAANQATSGASIFDYFNKLWPLLLTFFLVVVMITIGFVLLILPGIYLAVGYAMALPLVVEKNLSPWAAMEASRKAISKHWFKIFGLYIVLTIILWISAIPLGIGLIWTLPLALILYGVLYTTMFGYGNPMPTMDNSSMNQLGAESMGSVPQ